MLEQAWTSHTITANGITMHYLRSGAGLPLILLHGWPEWSYVWRKNIGPLATQFDIIAPDLRGFGRSDKPPLAAGADYLHKALVEDLRGLADALGLQRFGIVAHDIGAYIAQAFARVAPERLVGLFFFDCPYPGIGRRWAEANQIREIWYQSFHQLPLAAELVGASRESCRRYLRHFLDHWAAQPGRFDDDLELWVDTYMQPGALEGGFAWYRASHDARMALIRDGAPQLPPITVPTRVLWGARDPILKPAWTDRLLDYFTDLRVSLAPDAGHFVHYEQPALANQEITAFFQAFG
jgi:pimeloyl-ACP methyl ester carboxylesterase